jgi:hypothetical protein
VATGPRVTADICTEEASAATRDALKRPGEDLSLHHDDGQADEDPREVDHREDEPPG